LTNAKGNIVYFPNYDKLAAKYDEYKDKLTKLQLKCIQEILDIPKHCVDVTEGKPLGVHIHHIIPKSLGGHHADNENLAPLIRGCHLLTHALYNIVFDHWQLSHTVFMMRGGGSPGCNWSTDNYNEVFTDPEYKEAFINSITKACAQAAAHQIGNTWAKKDDNPSPNKKRRRDACNKSNKKKRDNPHRPTKRKVHIPDEDAQEMMNLYHKCIVTNPKQVFAKMVEISPANLQKYSRHQIKNKVYYCLRKDLKAPPPPPKSPLKDKVIFSDEDIQDIIDLYNKWVVTNPTQVFKKMEENSPANLKKYTRSQISNKIHHLLDYVKDSRMFLKAPRKK
jgi:hypothetical protein